MSRKIDVGDRVRTRLGGTGRYVGRDLALMISAQDGELMVDEVNREGEPHPLLSVPSDDAVDGAVEMANYLSAAGWLGRNVQESRTRF